MTKSKRTKNIEALEDEGAFKDESLDEVPTEDVAPDEGADQPVIEQVTEAEDVDDLGVDSEDFPVNGVDEGFDFVDAKAEEFDEEFGGVVDEDDDEAPDNGPDLPTFDPASVDTDFFISRPEIPDHRPLQNHSKIVASEVSANPDQQRAGVDFRFATPDTNVKTSAEPAVLGGDGWGARAQESLVAAEVRKAFERLGLNEESIKAAVLGASAVPDQTGGTPFTNAAPDVPKFKYHFRCDVAPELKIQALDMTALDRGQDPRHYPLSNRWITFRLGHLQTNDENVARQINFMRERPSVAPDGSTIGGNPSIYEDDGSVIFKCPDCDFVTASSNGFKAHRRASHGV